MALIITSAISYSIPEFFVHEYPLILKSPLGMAIGLLINAVLMFVYSYYYHNILENTITVNNTWLIPVLIMGIFYFVSWTTYTHAYQYQRLTLIPLQIIFSFVLVEIIAIMYTKESMHLGKIFGIIIIILGSLLMMYYDKKIDED